MIDIKSKKLDELVSFPCQFSIKIIGNNIPDFSVRILSVLQQAKISIIQDKISFNQSNGDKYLSMTCFFVAESAEQVHTVYGQISALDFVKMCL